MLETLALQGQTIVMTGLELNDFPPSVKSFVLIKEGLMKGICSGEELSAEKLEPVKLKIESFHWTNSTFTELVYLKDVSLQYNERVILDKINWQINSGERWSLSGPNGSGKTSLLNLIFGDNPKAYGCNIRLFGKQKGTGESIWDIKARIGFISP
jgi:ABC-type molybdenum transport system ATPase subunit/photorepair protein PhrA